MTPRIHTDASVIGGCLDSGFRQPSIRLMQLFRTSRAIPVLPI